MVIGTKTSVRSRFGVAASFRKRFCFAGKWPRVKPCRYDVSSHEQSYTVALVDSSVNSDDRAPLPDYSEDGVDLSLIRWSLSLTPLERLQFLQKQIHDILAIRELNART